MGNRIKSITTSTPPNWMKPTACLVQGFRDPMPEMEAPQKEKHSISVLATAAHANSKYQRADLKLKKSHKVQYPTPDAFVLALDMAVQQDSTFWGTIA